MNRIFRYLETRRSKDAGERISSDLPESEFEQLRAIWESSAQSDVPPEPDIENAWKRVQIQIARAEESVPARRPASSWSLAEWWPGRIAVAGGLGLALLLALLLVPRLLGESYQTDSLGQLTVMLPDSSTVTLCENSSFSVRRGLFDGSKTMTLQGSAYFSVRPQETPFIVTTSIGTVRVVGTQFDVRCDSKELYVAVSRGTVAVSSSSSGADSTVLVHRGEFASCLKGGKPGVPKISLTENGPMWLSGVVTFNHADLRSLCDEISRQLGVSIVVDNTSLDTLRVTGLIKGRDTRQILSALCELTGTMYRVEKGSYVVY